MLITVKAARINKGLYQQDVADHLGLSLNAYVRKENGLRRFYVDEIAKLSQLFGVSIVNFFEAQCHNKTREQKDEQTASEEVS